MKKRKIIILVLLISISSRYIYIKKDIMKSYIAIKISNTKNFFIKRYTRYCIEHGFILKNINISGNDIIEDDEIIDGSGLEFGDNIVPINIKSANKNIMQLSWVRNARIERKFPDTVNIKIQERIPKLIWKHNDNIIIIDDKNDLISEKSESEKLKYLIIAEGSDIIPCIDDILEIIQDSNIFSEVQIISRISNKRWNITLKNGTLVKLPEYGAKEAWRYFLVLYQKGNIKSMKVIDLRIEERSYVR